MSKKETEKSETKNNSKTKKSTSKSEVKPTSKSDAKSSPSKSQAKTTPEKSGVKSSSKAKKTKTKSDEKSLANETSGKNTHNKSIGERGEKAAARYLKTKGYEIVSQNWKCKIGEIDLVAIDGEALVFVEVKTRTSIEKGMPEDAVDAKKRKKYECLAACFLKENDYVDMPVRFDVIAILVVAKDRAMLRHHINAFGIA